MERKEYIVPNKDLVTERLLNWTLSDQMNRIEVILFLSHGADTDRGLRGNRLQNPAAASSNGNSARL